MAEEVVVRAGMGPEAVEVPLATVVVKEMGVHWVVTVVGWVEMAAVPGMVD